MLDKIGFASVLVPMVQFPALLLIPTPLRGYAIEQGTVILRSSLSTYIASIQSCRRSYAATIQWTLNRPYLKIKARYEAELRDHPMPLGTIEFLISYKATAMDSITHVLCRDLPGAAGEGTSIRRRLFFEYNEQGNAAGLQPTVFRTATQIGKSRCQPAPNGYVQRGGILLTISRRASSGFPQSSRNAENICLLRGFVR
jgi:hypothetical protein